MGAKNFLVSKTELVNENKLMQWQRRVINLDQNIPCQLKLQPNRQVCSHSNKILHHKQPIDIQYQLKNIWWSLFCDDAKGVKFPKWEAYFLIARPELWHYNEQRKTWWAISSCSPLPPPPTIGCAMSAPAAENWPVTRDLHHTLLPTTGYLPDQNHSSNLESRILDSRFLKSRF